MNSTLFSEGISGAIPEIDDAVLELIQWIKIRIRLKGIKVSEAWTEEHDAVAAEVGRAQRSPSLITLLSGWPLHARGARLSRTCRPLPASFSAQ